MKLCITKIVSSFLILLILTGCATSSNTKQNGEAVFDGMSSQDLILRAYEHDPQAQYELGLRYELGKGLPESFKDAVYWMRSAAKQGHIEAKFRLGGYHIIIAKKLFDEAKFDEAKKMFLSAKEWLEPIANNGHPKAQHEMARLYSEGLGVKKNWAIAEKWYRLAADQGDPFAEENLGRAYFSRGESGKVDYKIAAKYLHRSAKKGLVLSQYFLGTMYLNGHGVEQSNEEAFTWIRKSAENGFDVAQNDVASMYSNGQGTAVNEQEAIKWFKKSVAQNNTDAQANLGKRYLIGKGVVQNIHKAKRLLSKAAEKGNAHAAYDLASFYANQNFARFKNSKEAFKWFRLAALKKLEISYGYVIKFCKAINCNTNELQDIISNIKDSAKAGSSKSLHVLGYMYETGVGVKKEMTLSALNYYKSARSGNRASFDRLVSIYSSNDNLNLSGNDLLVLFKDYASKKAPSAYCGVGLVYLKDKDFIDDYKNAYFWMMQCVKYGYTIYQDKLYQLEKKLTPSEITKLKNKISLKN